MQKTIKVIVMSPNAVLWEGEAEALSSKNADGAFDILPNHANFMTLIKHTDVVLHLAGDKEQSFTFDQAVLFFHDDTAKMYVHMSEPLVGIKK